MQILSFLHKLVVQTAILHAAKPKTIAGEFDEVNVTADSVSVRNARYKTRIRSSAQVRPLCLFPSALNSPSDHNTDERSTR